MSHLSSEYWILWYLFISLPAIGLMCSTRSSTVPLTQRCAGQGSYKTRTSCVSRCGDAFNPRLSCQCNSLCGRHKDCCPDFGDVCNTSCAWRCDQGYDKPLSCQCNEQCQNHENCCDDYTEMCQNGGPIDTTPTVECDVTSYVKDVVQHISNDTFWTCIEKDVPSIHWLPDCSCPIGPDDLAVNLTKGLTTKMNCSALSNASISSPEPYSYTWRMNAPPNSKIHLLVHHSEGSTITVTNEDHGNSGHTFSLVDNDYVSVSNTVIINASLYDFKQGHLFGIEGWALEETDTTPTVECDVTSYVKDAVQHLSNYTFWTCIEKGVPSIHWLPDCSCPIGPDDLVVNLTKGLTTKINCSALSNASISSPEPYSYTWRMNAPPNSMIHLLVHHSEGSTITVTNGVDGNSGHTFSLDDNVYVSASNTVIINASLYDFKQGHLFGIEGWALEETDSDSSLSPFAIVLPTILLIVVGVSVIWILCRRRKVLTERKNLYCQSSDGPVNSTCNTVSSDHHGGPLHSAHDSPLFEMQPDASRIAQQQQNGRDGASNVIYNEIGEENYSVLFSGKEQGDYHTYVLPDRHIPDLPQEVQKTSNQRAGNTNQSDLQKQLGQEGPGNNHSYYVLEAGNETSPAPATGLISKDGSSSTTRVDPDSEALEGKPKVIPDDAARKLYDHPRKSAPEVLENHADSRTRHEAAEDDLANTYTTLDADPKDDGEYSHLQRPLGINLPSGHHHLDRDPCNEYGKLEGNTR
ncbi:uncharacterized protein LOC135157254 [Lytechinus pictus]|uniref:uncharacterized protein LOC135157254 n=1 Tax=Lytechinus pictus TaxID=7653 RepID=UPI0030B9FBC2